MEAKYHTPATRLIPKEMQYTPAVPCAFCSRKRRGAELLKYAINKMVARGNLEHLWCGPDGCRELRPFVEIADNVYVVVSPDRSGWKTLPLIRGRRRIILTILRCRRCARVHRDIVAASNDEGSERDDSPV